jgi:hypothetical protein
MLNNVMLVASSALVVATLTLAGCTTLTPQQEAQLQANANRQVTCTKGADCDMKWGRAVAWVSQNSEWKIQTQNDYIIQTYTPINQSAASGFKVNKVPTDTEHFEITISSGCDNLLACFPDAMTARASFNNFLIGPAPAVSTEPSQQTTTTKPAEK